MAKLLQEIRDSQKATGPATILAIGTAHPPTCYPQKDYPDFYFKVCKSEHMTDLKRKMQRICDVSGIRQRFMFHTEENLSKNPGMCTFDGASLNARQDMLIMEVPKLGAEAAEKAIKEWGQDKSKITHLIFCTTTSNDMPGADYQFATLFGLNPTVSRTMVYQQGCFAGGTVLRLVKDIAENNKGARVLVVCSEIVAFAFRGPHPDHIDSLIGQLLFGDGAAALVVGCDIDPAVEKPDDTSLFQNTIHAPLTSEDVCRVKRPVSYQGVRYDHPRVKASYLDLHYQHRHSKRSPRRPPLWCIPNASIIQDREENN